GIRDFHVTGVQTCALPIYRLNVFPVEMPPLRERADDLPALVSSITAQLAESGRGRVALAPDAIEVLRHYRWPGNVRELANLLEQIGRAACRGRGEDTVRDV